MSVDSPMFRATGDATARAGFWNTVQSGAAPSGKGLYMPAEFPADFFDTEVKPILESERRGEYSPGELFLDDGAALSTPELSAMIMRKFIPENDIGTEELFGIMQTALNFDIPLEQIYGGTFVLRLDRGPTASFKDVAARTLAGLMEKYCEVSGEKLNIVVATSGDTGVAVADAFGSKKGITVTILYPHGGVSPVQEKQMLDVAARYGNVQSLAIEGVFDDAQSVSKILQSVRGINALEGEEKDSAVNNILEEIRVKLGKFIDTNIIDAAYVEELGRLVDPLNISSANSINLWRLIPQITQYFVAYQQMVQQKHIQPGEEVVFSVPSGNVGHMTAGLFARKMGLPIKRFIAGTNANNILAHMIGGGKIGLGGFKSTLAPSMDIEGPNNFSRIIWLFAQELGLNDLEFDYAQMERDIKVLSNEIGVAQQALEEARKGGVAEKIIKAENNMQSLLKKRIPLTQYVTGETNKKKVREIIGEMQKLIWAEDVETDDELLGGMALVSHQTGGRIIMEPHGMAGLIAAKRARNKQVIGPNDKVITLETAHPDKFPEALEQAGITDVPHEKHPELERINSLEFESAQPVKIDLMAIAEKIARKARAAQILEEMREQYKTVSV